MKAHLKKVNLTILPFILVIFIDQFSKNWARTLINPAGYWNFKFQLAFNDGIILGLFSELPLNIKESTFTILGTFIFASYLMALWLMPIKSRSTYLGLSFLVGGIIGNVIDRFNGFSVVDFLSLQIGSWQSPYINFADLFQWVGYLLFFIGLHRDSLYYWPTRDWRSNFLINYHFQIRSSLLIASFPFIACLLGLVFSFSFLKDNQDLLVLNYFWFIGFFVAIVFFLMTFLLALYLTHRVAGPVYAIQRHIEDSLNGKKVKFKLREYDEFKNIEKILNQLNDKLSSITQEDEETKQSD